MLNKPWYDKKRTAKGPKADWRVVMAERKAVLEMAGYTFEERNGKWCYEVIKIDGGLTAYGQILEDVWGDFLFRIHGETLRACVEQAWKDFNEE